MATPALTAIERRRARAVRLASIRLIPVVDDVDPSRTASRTGSRRISGADHPVRARSERLLPRLLSASRIPPPPRMTIVTPVT
jgi:hypothetical protein